VTLDGTLARAESGQSLTVVLDRQLDIARGDLFSHAIDHPKLARRFGARLNWMDREPLAPGKRYWLKHTTQTVRATIDTLESRLDLATLTPDTTAPRLDFNDLGEVRIAVSRPLIADHYAVNRATGSFVLIDEASNHTVAAGMISEINGG
jgi:sulfate adenylyltransferase subunit 1 (EFTu-like GTPase family)